MATLYLDEDIAVALAVALRTLGHTVTTTTEKNRKGTYDHAQLWYAMGQQAIIITVNAWDFYLRDDAWKLWGVPHSHAGIIALASFGPPDVRPIATSIHLFLTRPEEMNTLNILAGREAVSVPSNGTFTNGYSYRRANGVWTDKPPKPRR